MGIIKAAVGAFSGTMADQWKEYICCEGLGGSALIAPGTVKRSQRSANTKGTDNVISDGSCIVLADGQAMVVVEGGVVVDSCTEPGEYTFRSDRSSGIFGRSGLGGVVRDIGNRIAFGGDAAIDQRVYYINTREIPGIPFETDGPVPFRMRDLSTGADMDVGVLCRGCYSFRILDPVKFYQTVTGNVGGASACRGLIGQMTSELLTALQPALAMLGGIRPSRLPACTEQLCQALNTAMAEKWAGLRGITVCSIALDGVALQDMAMVRELQKDRVLTDQTMAAAHLTGAAGSAMRDAAAGSSAAGMRLAARILAGPAAGQPAPWRCSCGEICTGNFCQKCGKRRKL